MHELPYPRRTLSASRKIARLLALGCFLLAHWLASDAFAADPFRLFFNHRPQDWSGKVQRPIEMFKERKTGKWMFKHPNGKIVSAYGHHDFVKIGNRYYIGRLHTEIASGVHGYPGPVEYAGTVTFTTDSPSRNYKQLKATGVDPGGELKRWDEGSGHYKPLPESAWQSGLPLNRFEPANFARPKTAPIKTYPKLRGVKYTQLGDTVYARGYDANYPNGLARQAPRGLGDPGLAFPSRGFGPGTALLLLEGAKFWVDTTMTPFLNLNREELATDERILAYNHAMGGIQNISRREFKFQEARFLDPRLVRGVTTASRKTRTADPYAAIVTAGREHKRLAPLPTNPVDGTTVISETTPVRSRSLFPALESIMGGEFRPSPATPLYVRPQFGRERELMELMKKYPERVILIP